MIDAIFKVLGAGLQLWADKEKHKYIDKMLALKKEFYEEYNKPFAERNTAVLDNVELELRQLCETFASAVGASGT